MQMRKGVEMTDKPAVTPFTGPQLQALKEDRNPQPPLIVRELIQQLENSESANTQLQQQVASLNADCIDLAGLRRDVLAFGEERAGFREQIASLEALHKDAREGWQREAEINTKNEHDLHGRVRELEAQLTEEKLVNEKWVQSLEKTNDELVAQLKASEQRLDSYICRVEQDLEPKLKAQNEQLTWYGEHDSGLRSYRLWAKAQIEAGATRIHELEEALRFGVRWLERWVSDGKVKYEQTPLCEMKAPLSPKDVK